MIVLTEVVPPLNAEKEEAGMLKLTELSDELSQYVTRNELVAEFEIETP
jgi:hypothetical protein